MRLKDFVNFEPCKVAQIVASIQCTPVPLVWIGYKFSYTYYFETLPLPSPLNGTLALSKFAHSILKSYCSLAHLY